MEKFSKTIGANEDILLQKPGLPGKGIIYAGHGFRPGRPGQKHGFRPDVSDGPLRGTREFDKRPIILVIIIASFVFFALGKITSDSDSNGGKMHLGRAFMKVLATVRGKQPHTTLVQKKLFANGGSLYPW